MAAKAKASVTIADISDGTDGTGIASTVVEYQAGSSGTTAPTGTWGTSIPTTSASAPYLWTRVTYTYTDGSPNKIVYSVGSTPEGIEVGGRNLVLGTSKPVINSNWMSVGWNGSFIATNDDRTYQLKAGNGWRVARYNLGEENIGKQFTISFSAKLLSSETTSTDGNALYFANGTSGTCESKIITSSLPQKDSWVKYTETFILNSTGFAGIGCHCVPEGYNFKTTWLIKDLKIEIGNKATDWTPAPEDVDSKIESVSSALEASDDVIVGTQTSVTGSWTGKAKFAELKDGQRIAYWLPYNGSGNATLNLTLSTGSTTGAIACYYSGASRITTHYPAGNVIHLTYKKDISIAGSSTKYTGWWADANYTTGDTYDRTKYNQPIKAGTTAIVGGNLIVGKDGTYTHLKLGSAFDVNYPILYADSSISASSTGTNNYLAIPFTVTTTQSITLTAYKPVYIKGTLSGSLFTPVSTAPLTQSVPATEDGYQYILLGTAYSTTGMYLLNEHPIFQYHNGAFKTTTQIATEAYTKANNAQLNIDSANGKITTLTSQTSDLGVRMSSVEQTANGLTARLTTVENVASDAAKTATNYLKYDISGLLIGNITTTLARNVLITPSSIQFRNNQTILAEYTDSTIYLGKNSTNSVINLCNGTVTMNQNTESGMFEIKSTDKLGLVSSSYTCLQTLYSDGTNAGISSIYTEVVSDAGFYPNVCLSALYGNDTDGYYQGKLELCYDNVRFGKRAPDGYQHWIEMFDASHNINISSENSSSKCSMTINPTSVTLVSGEMHNYGWYRSHNATGWYNETYGGGIYMSDSNSVKVYGGKSFVCNNDILVDGCNGIGQFRAIGGSTAFLIRNDGTNTYFMLTNSGNPYGFWNDFRPLTIENSTGKCSFGNGLVSGGKTSLFSDTEGGKIEFLSPNNNEWRMDAWANTCARLYCMQNYNPFLFYADGGFQTFGEAHLAMNGNNVFLGEHVVVTSSGNIRGTSDNAYACGTSAQRWTKVYAVNGTIQTSDEREKDIIGSIDDRYLRFFSETDPILYRWKYGEDKRVRVGIGAQTAERKLIESGLSLDDFAGIGHDYFDEPTDNGLTDRYSMDYTMYCILAAEQTKRNTKKINSLESDQALKEARIESLQVQLNEAMNQIAELKKLINTYFKEV